MSNVKLKKGIILMLISSGATCLGQLAWKLTVGKYALQLLVLGFFLYAIGAVLMITALKYGDLSILHPIMSCGYIFSVILGALVLQEPITWSKVSGIAIIIAGLVFLSHQGKEC